MLRLVLLQPLLQSLRLLLLLPLLLKLKPLLQSPHLLQLLLFQLLPLLLLHNGSRWSPKCSLKCGLLEET